ncbi:MAG: hypothetical protein ACRDK9_14570 [Solirubrobacterales bacterium]
MVIVEFRRPTHDESGHLSGYETVARVIADSGNVQVEGDESVVDLDQHALNLRTGASIAMSEDREEWARGLAAAYRTPYLWAEIVEDSNPLEDVEIERVELEDPARDSAAALH